MSILSNIGLGRKPAPKAKLAKTWDAPVAPIKAAEPKPAPIPFVRNRNFWEYPIGEVPTVRRAAR